MTERIALNISGAVFEVKLEILQRFPQTLLGCHYKRNQYFDHARNEYFFDRHRQAFEAILFYYQSNGRLVCPENVPDKVFDEEIEFFQIPKEPDKKDAGSIRFEAFMMNKQYPSRLASPWQRRLWEFCEKPDNTRFSRWVAAFSQLVIYLSVTASCLQTVKSLNRVDSTSTATLSMDEITEDNFSVKYILPNDFWFHFDIACFAWFTVECAIRFLAFPNKLEYFLTLANCIDVLTVIIFYAFLIVNVTAPDAVIPLRILRFMTMIRLFKLFRYSKKMKIFVLTLASGIRELCMLMIFCVMILIISSSAVFFAEYGIENSQFSSIPDAFWWSIITITTIGYGDKVPVSTMGKVIAAACAVFGALIIALPLFRFAAHFRRKLDYLSNKAYISYKPKTGKNAYDHF